MTPSFPALPGPDKLRFEDGDLVLRPVEISDASALFEILTDARMEFMPDDVLPASVEQFQEGIVRLQATSEIPVHHFYLVHELAGRVVGMALVRLQFLDENGGTEGPLLRTAVLANYRSPDVTGQNIAFRVAAMIEEFLVRHFGVQLLVGWTSDDNEAAIAAMLAGGSEGPLNHNHPLGFGFYRRWALKLDD